MQIEEASFRDKSGFIFYKENQVFRKIEESYLPHYTHLMQSGLYEELVKKELLIPHVEESRLIIKPEKLPFISYPNEWCFSQLKEAAILTLNIQKIAMRYNMELKDASAFNIQFHKGKVLFIDTLSFEMRMKDIPWRAYNQFCKHFLAPLALIAYANWQLKDLFLAHVDGFPLDLAAKLLPSKCLLKFGLLLHLFIHAKFKPANDINPKTSSNLAKEGIIESLESTIRSIKWKKPKTLWGNYSQEDSYTNKAFASKEKIVEELLMLVKPRVVFDIGCNDGLFSLLASKVAKTVVALDNDPICIERLFNKKTTIIPLLTDISNPTSSFGFGEKERKSLSKRGPADLIMALAVTHHLRISACIPFNKMAEYFQSLGNHLIVEFIPKTDKKIEKMLLFRENQFEDYSEKVFISDFSPFFEILKRREIEDSQRVIFLLKVRQ